MPIAFRHIKLYPINPSTRRMPHSVNHADTMAATATLEAHAVPATTTPASPVEPVAALVADVDALTIDGAKAGTSSTSGPSEMCSIR